MWENGFQTEEITLFENTFPHQYEFHAPGRMKNMTLYVSCDAKKFRSCLTNFTFFFISLQNWLCFLTVLLRIAISFVLRLRQGILSKHYWLIKRKIPRV
jgi:hypothetical protein